MRGRPPPEPATRSGRPHRETSHCGGGSYESPHLPRGWQALRTCDKLATQLATGSRQFPRRSWGGTYREHGPGAEMDAPGYLPVGEGPVGAVVDLTADRLGHFSDLGERAGVQGGGQTPGLRGVEVGGPEIQVI